MNRNHTAPFQKRGPRAMRIAERTAHAMVEIECEKYVREKLRPELVRGARMALAGFKRQTGR
jgi:hypothetical protein